jgi:hypothetical protein
MSRRYGQLRTRQCASKETAMPRRILVQFLALFLAQFLALLLASGYLIVAGSVGLEQAQAQYIPPPTPLPPPVLNPSNPNTVAQPPYRPIAPSTPSATPGYVISSPSSEGLPRATARSHRRTSVAKSERAPSLRRRGRATVVRAAPESYSYYSQFGYGYGCAWRRAWDGYWFRTSPCS